MPEKPPAWRPRIILILLILSAAAWAAKTIRLETELLALLPQHLPSVRGLDSFQRQFASDREVIIVADDALPPAQRDELFARIKPALAALRGVESVRAPGEEWAQAAPQLAAWMAWNLAPEQFAKLRAALQPGPVKQRLEELPDTLAGAIDAETLALRQFDPLRLLDSFNDGPADGASPFQWSADEAKSLTITASRPLIAFQDCADFCDAVRGVIRDAAPGETRLLLTGRPAFTAEISTQMRRDMILMLTVAVTLASAAFWAFYRTLKPLGWILLGQFLALGVALLGARIGVGSLNVISMGFGCILLGVSMDYSILVYHHFASESRDDPAVWRRLRRGIRFSAATTAAAFLVLAFSSVPGLRQLAILVAAGLVTSAWFATWLLPAPWIRHPQKSLPFVRRASSGTASVMHRHGRRILGAALVVSLAGGWLLARDPLSFYAPDLNRFQPSDSEAFRGQLALVRHDPSATDAIFLVQAPAWPAVKSAAAELRARFDAKGHDPLAALIPAVDNQRANRTAWTSGIAPRLREAFDTAGLGDEWSRGTLAFVDSLDKAAAGDPEAFAPARGTLDRIMREDAAGCRTVVRIPGAADAPVPPRGLEIPGAEILPASWVALKSELNATSLSDLRRLGAGAFAAILILCALAHRSLRLVLLNVAALAIALLIFATLLAVTGTRLSAMSLLSVPLLIGLVIDYSIHVLMAVEHEHGDLDKMYAHIGAPILLTGLASTIGFGAPMLTSQPALQNFGLVMDLGIIAAVSTCLFLLPVLARMTARRPAPLQTHGEPR